LEKADHVIVLMMENRSFDHFFGYLSLQGKTDVDGLNGKETNPYKGDSFKVFAIDNPDNDWRTSFPLKSAFWPDPIHAHCPTWTQMLNVKKCGTVKSKTGKPTAISNCEPNGEQINMEGFALSYRECDPKSKNNSQQQIMGYYTEKTLPTYRALVDNYCLVNQWFSSNVGSTIPNRMFSLAGTTVVKNYPSPIVDNTQVLDALKANEIEDKFEHALEARTIFDALSDKGISWQYYYHNLCLLWLFNDYLTSPNTKQIDNLWKILDGRSDEALPQVTWIDPAYTLEFDTGHPLDTLFGNDDHSPTDVRLGQLLVQTLYEKLVASKYWENTLLIITYDEHGGMYDHVPPPATCEAPPFQNYGVRVPTLLISPWVKRGSVVSNEFTFDHTSLIRSLLDRFCDSENLDGDTLNRSDNATSLNVVAACDQRRTDVPYKIDAPDVSQLEKDLLLWTDQYESPIVDGARDGISDWQELLKVLVELRRIIEGGESLLCKIVRWILKLFGIKQNKIDKPVVAWSKENLRDQAKRAVSKFRRTSDDG